MPSGKVHTKATGVVYASSLILLPFVVSIEQALLFSYGCLIGMVVTPDNDVDNGHVGIGIVRHLFGSRVSDMYQAYWYPYARIMPHRGFWSHFPIISTFIRFIYLSVPFLFLSLITGWRAEINFYPLLIGLIVVDSLHWLFDTVSTYFKRRINKYLKKR